jgi:hypothetical protein
MLFARDSMNTVHNEGMKIFLPQSSILVGFWRKGEWEKGKKKPLTFSPNPIPT